MVTDGPNKSWTGDLLPPIKAGMGTNGPIKAGLVTDGSQ